MMALTGTCQSNKAPLIWEPKSETYSMTWGLGSDLASLVPFLGDAFVVVGDKKVSFFPSFYQEPAKELQKPASSDLMMQKLFGPIDKNNNRA